jgi:hypothetical protein
MNTRLLADLMRARILEAHRMKSLQRENPPCVPQIVAERTKLAGIDAQIRMEVRHVPN